MLDDTGKTGRNAAQRARLQAARAAIVHKMEVEGWQPTKLRGYSKRYRVMMQKGHSATVAIKVQTVHRGWVGWAQKKKNGWGSPLTDTDYILMATPCPGGLGVWMAPTAAVRDRLELVQQLYAGLNRGQSAALWFNLFELPNEQTARSNFAGGKPPMWVLPFEVSDEAENDGAQAAHEAPELRPLAPSGLAAFSNGQLIDELMRRGLKSFSFG